MRRVTRNTSASASASAASSPRRAAGWLVVAAILAASPGASADTIEACAADSEEAQVQRDKGALRAARERLVRCASDACPKVVRQDCAAWLETIDRQIPSIIPRVRDADGRDRADVRVLVDGAEVATSLDGRALPVDPGERRLRLEPAGAAPVEQTLVVREGEQGRTIDVTLPGEKSAAPPPPPSAPSPDASGLHIPVASWILGGVALAGGGVFTIFGLRAKGEVDDMRGTCAPSCDPARVDAAKRDALVANIALGVGATALAGAVVLVLVTPRPPPAAQGARPRPAPLQLGLASTPGPGLSLTGSF